MPPSASHSALALNLPTELSPISLANAILSSFQKLNISPEDYPEIAPQIASLSKDIENVHFDQTQRSEQDAEELERYYASRTKEYEELQKQIQSSGEILALLSGFLAQFQGDLSSVSSSIAELQARSKLIETRLESRRLLETNLTPYISTTIIPPELISTIMSTEPGEPWLDAIKSLDVRLTALRTSSLEKRPPERADQVAEKLRLVAADKIRTFLIAALGPFRISISANLKITQSSLLLKYRSLFAFLQRHAARTANEVQKAYVGTVRWYYETGLRRYVRALEKIKARGWPKVGLAGSPQPVQVTLDGSVVAQSQLEGADVVLAYMAESSTFKQPPEALFRSLTLVVADNVVSEYNFVSHFFGQPSLPSGPSRSGSPLFHGRHGIDLPNDGSSAGSVMGGGQRMARKGSVISSVADSDSIVTGTGSEAVGSGSGRIGERKSHTAIDLVWKQIVEPVFEYHKTFTLKLVPMTDLPDTNSIYAMIQLNESLLSAVGSKSGWLETHLMAIKMMLWPAFQMQMNREVGSMGALATQPAREADVRAAGRRYVWLFATLVGMDIGREAEESKVASDLRRLRDALVAAIQASADRAHTAPDARKAFLNRVYQEIQQELMAAAASQVRSQAEAAFWRELVWRTR